MIENWTRSRTIAMSILCRKLGLFAMVAAGLAASSHAHAAAACDAPWMHAGGSFTLTALPSGHVTHFTMLSFDKKDGSHCSGKVRTTATMTLGGRTNQSESTMNLRIVDGKAELHAETANGSLQSSSTLGGMAATVSAQNSGLLSYVGEITSDGQRLPPTRTDASLAGTISKMGAVAGQFSAPKITVITSEKQVGKQAQIDTAAGKQVCWPITYDQTQHSNSVMMGHVSNITSTTHVVDYFCPAAGLVMRKDLTTDGKKASQIVSAIN